MKLKIQKPCTENWDKMTSSQIGKHCEKCEKSIYDLSSKTDQEIISFFQNKEENICGRLTKFQLNHDFYTAKKGSSNSFNRYVAASFTILALTPALVAQTNDLNVRTPIAVNKNIKAISLNTNPIQKKDVRLKLKDQSGQLLANASVRFSTGGGTFMTDSLGVVEFNIPEKLKGKTISLIVESSRFRQGEFQLDYKNTPLTQTISVEMYEIMMLGEMIPYEEKEIIPVKKDCKPKK